MGPMGSRSLFCEPSYFSMFRVLKKMPSVPRSRERFCCGADGVCVYDHTRDPDLLEFFLSILQEHHICLALTASLGHCLAPKERGKAKGLEPEFLISGSLCSENASPLGETG